MCGITGAIWTDPKLAIEPDVLSRMTEALRHRGPDGEGAYRAEYRLRPPYEALPGVALGFRRLAIIDVAGGAQPLSNEDGSVWLVCNGEIFNYVALRHRLEGAGHTFKTHSDCETIVHLYEAEGPACFEHLNGMFAVAIWDANLRRLVLGRDRLGKKPLVYRHEAGRLLFASELKSLLTVPGVPREIDASAVDEYLTYQYIPHPNTIFRGIRTLPPGHHAVLQDERLEVRPYWKPDFQRELRISEEGAAEQLSVALDSAVRLRLQSEVPLGAFLSGGVDSSLVVALMQKHLGEPVKTFSIGFAEKEFDETRYARQVAAHLKTEHHDLQVTPNAVEMLPKLIKQFDEPFADSSAVPTWCVSQLAREHVTVALTGDGGDELFAGYPRYNAVALAASLDRFWPARGFAGARLWQSLPGGSGPKSLVRRFQRFSAALGRSPARRYFDWISIFSETQRAELYRDEFVAQLPSTDPFAFLDSAWKRAVGRDAVTTASLADLITYLPCDLLTKVDMASMAHSLECRQPFLDHRVVELAASLPIGYKYRRGRGKRILRKAFGHLLPREIWNRPKMGFGVPLAHWFRNELKPLTHDLLLADAAKSREFFRGETVARLVSEHESRSRDHSHRLWALLVFELWLKEWAS